MEKEKKIKLPEAFVKTEKWLDGRGGNASGRIPGRTCKSSLGEGRILLRGRYAPGTSSVP